jgi:hypothetical protein
MPQTKSSSRLSLEQKITFARQRLQALYDARGYTDSVVLAASIELDELMNEYQKRTVASSKSE